MAAVIVSNVVCSRRGLLIFIFYLCNFLLRNVGKMKNVTNIKAVENVFCVHDLYHMKTLLHYESKTRL